MNEYMNLSDRRMDIINFECCFSLKICPIDWNHKNIYELTFTVDVDQGDYQSTTV
jgi:hypothetical protein